MTRRMALLVNPPTGLYVREDRCQVPVEGMVAPTVRPPLDLGYMAAVLEARGWQCVLRDYPAEGTSWDGFRRDLRGMCQDLLFVSTTTPTLTGDLKAVELAGRECPRVRTVAKGAHFLAEAESVLERAPALDVAVRGECEEAAGEIADGRDPAEILGIAYRQNGAVRLTPPRPFLEPLDRLPRPARHLMRNDLYRRPDTGKRQTTVLASRGCPYPCVFCLAGPVHGRRLRARSPEGVEAEVLACQTELGIGSFYFQADTFTLDRPWVLALCERLERVNPLPAWVCNSRVDHVDAELARRMRRAGCWGVALGLESASPAVLERVGKGISPEASRRAVRACGEAGLTVSLMFLIGLPWDTRETIRETIAFARSLPGHVYEFNLAYPFPGTPLHRTAREAGLLPEGDLAGFDYTNSPARTFSLSAVELLRLRRRALLAVYARPTYVARVLLAARSPAVAWKYLTFGWWKLRTLFKKA